MILSKNFNLFILIFFIINLIALLIYFIFIKKIVYQVNFKENDTFDLIADDLQEEIFSGIIYYKKLIELNDNMLINNLKNHNICMNGENAEIKRAYFHFLVSSFAFVNINRDLFSESVDINSYFNDPVDKLYRVGISQKNHKISIAIFSINKFYSRSYLTKVIKSLKNTILEYIIDPHDNHNVSNYNYILNTNYTNLKKNLTKVIFLNIFEKYKTNKFDIALKNNFLSRYKSNNPNLHFFNNFGFLYSNLNLLNECEKKIFKLLHLHKKDVFISKNNKLSYKMQFKDFKNSISESPLEIIDLHKITILNMNNILFLLLINFVMSLILIFIIRKL